MPKSFARDLEAFYQARLEQMPLYHRVMVEGKTDLLGAQEMADLFAEMIALMREMVMQTALEIDELRGSIQ